VSGPILLTGLATCATCGGGMTLRAGTSRMGEIYRYYSCSNAMKKGKTACRGRSIRMDKLDTLVTEHLADRLLEPERLAGMLTTLAGRRADKQAAVDKRIVSLAREAEDAGERLRRLYKLVEDGLAQIDELLKDRIAALKAAREAAMAALDRAKSATQPIDSVSPLAVDRFVRAMRERLRTGDVPFRKAYIGSIVDRIEVDDTQVRIMGRKEVLEQAVRCGAPSTSAAPIRTS
jgi:site-specific DNA recombinase